MVQAETVRAVHGAARVSRIAGSAKLRLLRNAALAAAFAALPLLHAAAFATLPDIVTSTTVPANGDVNPYGVAIVPNGFPTGSAINPGDILVSNFNNMKNLQGTGSTIINPDSADRMGLKVPAAKSYTQIVYSGGARVTVAPVVLLLLQTLVVDEVAEARTRQGAQLTSIRLVPS